MKFRRSNGKDLEEALSHAGRLLLEARDEENLQFLEEAVQQFSGNAELHLLYASVLLTSRPDDVAPEAVKAIELSPDDPAVLLRAASLLLRRGKPDLARSPLRRARGLAGPDFLLMAGLLHAEGMLAVLDHDNELAEKKLRAAVERDPESGPFACTFACLLRDLGQQDEALAFIDTALRHAEPKARLEQLRRELLAQ